MSAPSLTIPGADHEHGARRRQVDCLILSSFVCLRPLRYLFLTFYRNHEGDIKLDILQFPRHNVSLSIPSVLTAILNTNMVDDLDSDLFCYDFSLRDTPHEILHILLKGLDLVFLEHLSSPGGADR
jgi:hypothetical protein